MLVNMASVSYFSANYIFDEVRNKLFYDGYYPDLQNDVQTIGIILNFGGLPHPVFPE